MLNTRIQPCGTPLKGAMRVQNNNCLNLERFPQRKYWQLQFSSLC